VEIPKAIALDIETANTSMSGLDFNDPQGWKVACIGIYDGVHDVAHLYVANKAAVVQDLGVDPPMLVHPISALYADLKHWFEQGFSMITHNGAGFDLPILAKSVQEGGAGCAAVLNDYEQEGLHIDTCRWLFERSNCRVHLADLSRSILGTTPASEKLMPAAEAPLAWAQHRYAEVAKYCIQDCVLTYRAWKMAGIENGIWAVPGHPPGDRLNVRLLEFVPVNWWNS